MSGSEILQDWQGKRVGVQLSGRGMMEGELVRSDAVGVLIAMDRTAYSTPVGDITAAEGEDTTTAFCFLPWTQAGMIVPLPGELP